jgi:hypothetical protein
VIPIDSGTHSATLLWKANKRAASATIFAGAGAGAPYSVTALTAQIISC